MLLLSFLFPSQVLLGAVVLQAGQYGCVKHFLKIFLGQRGALHVGHSSNLHRTVPGVRWYHRLLPILSQVNENLNNEGNTVLCTFLNHLWTFTTSDNFLIVIFEHLVNFLQRLCILKFAAQSIQLQVLCTENVAKVGFLISY